MWFFFTIVIFPCTIKSLHSSCLTFTQSWFGESSVNALRVKPNGVFCRRHFRMHSLEPKYLYFLSNSNTICSYINGPGVETIPLTNDDQVSRSHIAAIGHNELTSRLWDPSISVIVIPLLSQVICDIYYSRNPRPQTLHDKLCRFSVCAWVWLLHDDVIKWKHFLRGIHRSPMYFPHKRQWRGALMFLQSAPK